ncbi:MAG: membrane protein insertion efficiency factor YidD [Microgenomates group bacterium]
MKKGILWLLKKYKSISFFQGFFGTSCRFYPTCSDYTYQAVEKYGALKGLVLGLYRILRCNPFNKGGIDKLS